MKTQTNKAVKKRLKTLEKIEKIRKKTNPTGKEVGTLFLLSACAEVKNKLNGCNIAPVTAEELQNKVNSVIATEDLIELNCYINFMNSIKSSYNLCTAYKIKAKYRLAGYTLILERLQHLKECIELSNGASKYITKLKKELKSVHTLTELEKVIKNEAVYPYLHNVFIMTAINAHKIEELECFKIDTADVENEAESCKNTADLLLSELYKAYGTGNYKPTLSLKELTPTKDQVNKITKLVESIKNYNFYSPVLRHLYFESENKNYGDSLND